MNTIKLTLILGLAAFVAPYSQAQLIDFHFGAQTLTGAVVLGAKGDLWNVANTTNGGPLLLKNTTGGASTTVSATWTSSAAWEVTKPIYSNTGGTAMDPATTWLMSSFAGSYAYGSGPTNLVLFLSGLAPSQAYTLVLYGAGDSNNEGTAFTVNGAATYTGLPPVLPARSAAEQVSPTRPFRSSAPRREH